MAATATFLHNPPSASWGPGAVDLRWGGPRVVGVRSAGRGRSPPSLAATCLMEGAGGGGAGDGGKKGGGGGGVGAVPNSNYVVPLDKAAPGIIRPLGEILRDLNKRVEDKIINKVDRSIPWYHVNRLLSFYAPGWSGEIRKVKFSDKGVVTVVYRVTVRGSDGEKTRNPRWCWTSVGAGSDREDVGQCAETLDSDAGMSDLDGGGAERRHRSSSVLILN